MKKLLSGLIALIIIISTLTLSVYAAADDESGVIEDLTEATVAGEAFDFSGYPAVPGGEAEIISFVEAGYGTSEYTLYVYVYNPSQTSIVSNSGKNKIQLATSWSESGSAETYDKFVLELLDISDGQYLNRFIKFKVVDKVSENDGFKISERVKRSARKYTVSGVELHYTGSANAVEIKDGHEYTFTGTGSYVAASAKDILVLELDVNDTYWRSDSSSAGINHQNQINSVYFSVPNDILDTYGYITRIKSSWNEQKLNPIVVTESQTLYNALNSWVGEDIGGQTNNSVTQGFGAVNELSGLAGSTTRVCYYTYNIPSVFLGWSGVTTLTSNKIIRILPGIFKTDTISEGSVNVSATTLKNHLSSNEYAKWLFNTSVDSGRTKGEQVQTIDLADKLQLSNYASNHNWWDKFWTHTIKGVNIYDEYKSDEPIKTVSSTDVSETLEASEISDNLYVAEEDVSELRAAYNEAQSEDKQLMLFRFAVTDYFSTELTPKNILNDGDTYGFEETVFLDFDIIELTFLKDGVYTVIPVVASPIDAVGSGTAPSTVNDDKLDMSWLKVLLSVVIIAVGAVMLMPLINKAIESFSDVAGGMIDGIGRRKK